MPKKILLADDSVTIQKVVELTFVEGDYEVTCVSNGKAAVQKIQEARPDVLLCDVIMPEMNGYEVASFIKKNPTYSGIPVVLLTGTFEPFDEEKARASGADTYITKPFDSRLLVEKVEELISRRAVFAAEAAVEPVQVFHSRQEFTLETPPALQVPEPMAATPEPPPAPPTEEAFLEEEREFTLPTEQEVGMGTVQGLAPPPQPAPHEAPAPPSADESPFMESPFAVPPVSAPVPVPLEVPEAFREAGETVDLGPMQPEDAIPEAEVPVEVTPAHEFLPEPGEVVLPPEPPVPAEKAEEAAVTVPGAEDWGAAEAAPSDQKWASFEEAPEEVGAEIVHAMTDQQEMVSEAQSVLEQQKALEGVDLPGAGEGLVEESGVPALQVPVAQVFAAIPEAVEAAPPAAPMEPTPVLPEEGIETGLPEILETVPAEPAAHLVEGGGEATVEEEVLPEPPRAELEAGVPIEEAAFEEPPPLGPGVTLLGLEVPPAEESAPIQPEFEGAPTPPAAPELQPAAVGAALDPAEVERIVRQVVEELAPPLVREVAASLVPEAVRPAVAEAVPEEARRAVAELAPPITRHAAEGAVLEAAKQAVEESLPGTLSEVAKAQLPAAVQALAEPMIPGVVRQVAEEAAEGTIRQVAEAMIPGVLAELLQRVLPGMVAEQLKALLPGLVGREVRESASAVVREVAWEVIPELAESLIKRRIQELEAEVG